MDSNQSMDGDARLAAAQHQLGLVLGFFGRADAKLSVVLGIDLAMLGVLFARASITKNMSWLAWIGGTIFIALLLCSFVQLFRGSFPYLNGGHASLVYFREIGTLRESEFQSRYRALTAEQLANDYLEQAWRNAKILTMKFDRLKSAYVYMAWAALPWAIVLTVLARGGK